MNDNIWNCSLLFIKQTNGRYQNSRPADVKQIHKPANLLTASQQSTDNAATVAPTNPCPSVGAEASAPSQSSPPAKISAQSLFNQKTRPTHRSYPRASRKRIPRVPACYPPTSTPQLTGKDDGQQAASRAARRPRRRTNRRIVALQIHPTHRQRLRQLTPLVLAARNLPASPCKMLTLPQRTSRPYRTWRRQPVKEWSSIKRGSSVLASN